jgi:hypothetical protein
MPLRAAGPTGRRLKCLKLKIARRQKTGDSRRKDKRKKGILEEWKDGMMGEHRRQQRK